MSDKNTVFLLKIIMSLLPREIVS